MNTDILQGKWKQFTGQIQQKWGEISNDELQAINGNREQFLGKLQEKYGIAKDEAEEELKKFEKSMAA